MIPSDSITIRQYVESNDKAYIYSTWLRNYKHSSYFAKRIPHSIFFDGHQKIVDHLLSKPETSALIATPKDDDETILGYLVYEKREKPIVHFMFVKNAFRAMGVARALFKHADIDPNNMRFTHWTFPVDELIQKWDGMVYDPYKL